MGLQEQQFLALFCSGMDRERRKRAEGLSEERASAREKSHFSHSFFHSHRFNDARGDERERASEHRTVIINSRSLLDHRRRHPPSLIVVRSSATRDRQKRDEKGKRIRRRLVATGRWLTASALRYVHLVNHRFKKATQDQLANKPGRFSLPS